MRTKDLPDNAVSEVLDSKRSCLNCYHFWHDDGHPGYSEVTPGQLPSFGCQRNHFLFDGYQFGNVFFKMKTMLNCPDYIHEDEWKNEN